MWSKRVTEILLHILVLCSCIKSVSYLGQGSPPRAFVQPVAQGGPGDLIFYCPEKQRDKKRHCILMGSLSWSMLCVDVQITTDDALSNYVLCIHKQEKQLPNCQYLSWFSPNGCVSHGHTGRGIKEMRGRNDRGGSFKWGDTCLSNTEMNSILLENDWNSPALQAFSSLK